MTTSKRIFVNVSFSYIRTFVSALLILCSSRWVLAALGASDYGLYGLVGGLLMMVTFINAILSQGVSRFLAFAIGENCKGQVKEWFNIAVNIYFLLPIIILPLGWGIGIYFINHIFDIAPERMVAAVFVLGFSLLTVFTSMIATPFLAILTAYQHINITSMIALLHSFGQFFIGFYLFRFQENTLIWYTALIALSFTVMNLAYIIVAIHLCSEARLCFGSWWHKDKLKQLFSYTSLILVGTMGHVIRGQIVSIVLNRTAGTVANAGHSIANNLSGQMQTLSNSFLMATVPEITRRAGTGDSDRMLSMAQRSSKLGSFLILIVAIPLFFECETVLRLWLKVPPPFSVPFTKIVIVSAVIYKLAVGHRMAFQACGRIKRLQITEFVCYSLTAFVVWGIVSLTGSVVIGMLPVAFFQGAYVFILAIIGQQMFSWKVIDFIVQLVIPTIVCFWVGWLLYVMLSAVQQPGFFRIVMSTSVINIIISGIFWYFIFDHADRKFCMDAWQNMLSRFRGKSKVK